jgi:iron complex transport system substrate-binding protein
MVSFMMRLVLPLLIALVGTAIHGAGAQAAIVVTDIRGNTVSLSEPAHRIAVDDGRTIIAMSFLSDDPVARLAAWPHDVNRMGQEIYDAYRRKFPAIETLPRLASNAQEANIEQMLSVRPDVVFLSTSSHVSEMQVDQLKAGGIAVLFIDFQSDPLDNTDRSIEIMGKAMAREAAASRVVALRQEARRVIETRLTDATRSGGQSDQKTPVVFVEPHASTQDACCNSPGEGGVGTFLTLIGVDNVGRAIGNRPSGKLLMENLIAARPNVYIATGGAYMKGRGGLLIGPAFDDKDTQASLSALLARTGFSALQLKPDQVHGLSQQLFNSPLDILTLQLFAKWAWPNVFADIDPEKTMQAMNRLSAVRLEGTFWTQ